MLIKEYESIIFWDLWKKIEYEYRFWQDFNVAIVNDIIYRFPKEEINIESLLIEKRSWI